jgi:hypothetical protein
MCNFLTALSSITQRHELISQRSKIAMLEFQMYVEVEDAPKSEEARVAIHQLLDDQLDLQLEAHKLKMEHEQAIMDRFLRDLDN